MAEKLVWFFENPGVEGNRVTNVISAEKVVGEDRVVFDDHRSGEFFGHPGGDHGPGRERCA